MNQAITFGVALIWRSLIAEQLNSCIAISKPEVSVPISCWVTFDPAKSPILPGRNFLFTCASEYNPYLSFGKKTHKFL